MEHSIDEDKLADSMMRLMLEDKLADSIVEDIDEALKYKGAWAAGAFSENDIVSSNNKRWRAKQDIANSAAAPSAGANWEEWSGGGAAPTIPDFEEVPAANISTTGSPAATAAQSQEYTITIPNSKTLADIAGDGIIIQFNGGSAHNTLANDDLVQDMSPLPLIATSGFKWIKFSYGGQQAGTFSFEAYQALATSTTFKVRAFADHGTGQNLSTTSVQKVWIKLKPSS